MHELYYGFCHPMRSNFLSAPSAPRDVSARLVAPLEVEVRWRSPAVTNGDISHYTVFATPLRSTVSNNTLQTLQMVAMSQTIVTFIIHDACRDSAIRCNNF